MSYNGGIRVNVVKTSKTEIETVPNVDQDIFGLKGDMPDLVVPDEQSFEHNEQFYSVKKNKGTTVSLSESEIRFTTDWSLGSLVPFYGLRHQLWEFFWTKVGIVFVYLLFLTGIAVRQSVRLDINVMLSQGAWWTLLCFLAMMAFQVYECKVARRLSLLRCKWKSFEHFIESENAWHVAGVVVLFFCTTFLFYMIYILWR